MSEEIKGQLSYKERRKAKNGNEYYSAAIGGTKVIIWKPSDDAFNANATVAQAWEVLESVGTGAIVQGSFEVDGNFNKLIELEVLKGAAAESVEKPSRAEDKVYWEAKEKREDMRSALHAAVALAGHKIQAGEELKSGAVVDVAKVFYKAIREAE